jgi:hypothetical protein
MKFGKMDAVHHLLSGFKAKFTEEACLAVDKCRLSAGGAGFASHSGFTDIWIMISPNPTWEGDNTVMYLHTKELKQIQLLFYPILSLISQRLINFFK